jgi:hypothetical protein
MRIITGTLCGHNEFLDVKAGGTYSNHCAGIHIDLPVEQRKKGFVLGLGTPNEGNKFQFACLT